MAFEQGVKRSVLREYIKVLFTSQSNGGNFPKVWNIQGKTKLYKYSPEGYACLNPFNERRACHGLHWPSGPMTQFRSRARGAFGGVVRMNQTLGSRALSTNLKHHSIRSTPACTYNPGDEGDLIGFQPGWTRGQKPGCRVCFSPGQLYNWKSNMRKGDLHMASVSGLTGSSIWRSKLEVLLGGKRKEDRDSITSHGVYPLWVRYDKKRNKGPEKSLACGSLDCPCLAATAASD